jgi:hypothetical protein
MDVYEVLYPNYQLAFEVDRSSNHLKYDTDALIVSNLNLKWGGKQTLMRPSIIISDECLGPYSKILKVGDVQAFQFDENSSGPFYDITASKYDIPYSESEKQQIISENNRTFPTSMSLVKKRRMVRKTKRDQTKWKGPIIF